MNSSLRLAAASAALGIGLMVLWWSTSGPQPISLPEGQPAAIDTPARPAVRHPIAPISLRDPTSQRPQAPAARLSPRDATSTPPHALPTDEPHARFRGRVSGYLGDGVILSICGERRHLRDGRSFEADLAPGETCEVFAYRRDGALVRRSQVLTLHEGDDPSMALQLVLPEESTGGIGAIIDPTEEGVRLVHLVDRGGAAESGLQAGDVITSANGEPLAGLTTAEAQDLIVGAEGSTVELVVQGEDGERVVEVVRGWIERRPEFTFP